MKTFLVFILFIFSSWAFSQCGKEETITICDITVIDGDNDGIPDGILNLYDAYFDLTGETIEQGIWFDPNFDFVLNQTTGDITLWNLNEASVNINDYKYVLFNSSCGDTPALTINVTIGAFSGFALPAVGANSINYRVCSSSDVCSNIESFNLFGGFQQDPAPHLNGYWTYEGSSPNFIKIEGTRIFVEVPYQPGPPLVDEEIFELTYVVPDMISCMGDQKTTVNVSVVRQASSGDSQLTQICEQDIIDGLFDDDIIISDDIYLKDEDVEGQWFGGSDTGNQISSVSDSIVNIKTTYEDFVAINPRFGVKTFNFRYQVDQRSVVCSDLGSDIPFVVYESLRPFKQKENLIVCVDKNTPTTINLMDELEFTTENGVIYDYMPGTSAVWEYVSGPIEPVLTPEGEVIITDPALGTYSYRYTVSPEVNCGDCTSLEYESKGCLKVINNVNYPCASSESTLVTFTLTELLYAGENTTGIELCKEDVAIDLISLLETNEDENVYRGEKGVWTDILGNIFPNEFIAPELEGEQTFDFTYTTINNALCIRTATLSFSVLTEFKSGIGTSIELCETAPGFNLFDLLTGDKNTNGTWSGPNSYSASYLGEFNPATEVSGDYIYRVPDSEACLGAETIVNVTISEGLYAGEDTTGLEICKDEITIDLISLLETNKDENVYRGEKGVWTNALGNIISNDFTVPDFDGEETFSFTYTTTNTIDCIDNATLSFTVFTAFESGIGTSIELCETASEFNLFDLLTGDKNTNGKWSGPNSYSASYLGEFNPAIEVSGDYIYTVAGSRVCQETQSVIAVNVSKGLYAGEDTIGVEICKDESTIDLISLLETNGINTVYRGEKGVWTNALGNITPNDFTVPDFDREETFSFTYSTTNTIDCTDNASLSFTIFTGYKAGIGTLIESCETASSFNLFDRLTGDKDTNGTWSGPNGYTASFRGEFDPAIEVSGNYIYTVPGNSVCLGVESVIPVIVHKIPNAGENITITLCRSEGEINVFDYLSDDIEKDGIVVTVNTKTIIPLGVLDLSTIEEDTVILEYKIDRNNSCTVDTAIITIQLTGSISPVIAEKTSFCILDRATLSDIQISSSTNFNWYATETSGTPLPLDTLLKNSTYYLVNVDNDGCESLPIIVNVIIHGIGEGNNCKSNISDGISPNGDGQNDSLDLGEFEEAFPNFIVSIYNRNGSLVYEGKLGTPYFSGISNISSSSGNALSSGVYYYIFEPNDGISNSFQSTFYLSKK